MVKKYQVIILILILTIIIIIYFLFKFNIISQKKYKDGYFHIQTYTSSIDMDNDGIDDQTDILNGVKKYLATKPKYKSKYYDTGYPDDGYGVCTDVVAFGLLEAGYDLMELVNIDIINNSQRYNIENVDKNIDFRRVKNLKIYFANNAIALTTDITNINDWQAGDIVLFKNHIGIISDSRNKNGIPFVFHHASPYQISYEEDILERRTDIVGHYRISWKE